MNKAGVKVEEMVPATEAAKPPPIPVRIFSLVLFYILVIVICNLLIWFNYLF